MDDFLPGSYSTFHAIDPRSHSIVLQPLLRLSLAFLHQYGYDFATWIKGTSMSPKYLDGEVALIRETGFDYDGAVYALVWNEQTYIKKLYKVEDGFRMVSINEVGNPERFISKDDNFRIVGLVVGHFMPVEGV